MQILGGGADVNFVVAGKLGEVVLLHVENREAQRIERKRHGLRFAGGEGNTIPGGEAFVGFTGSFGQFDVDLGDFRAGPRAGIFHCEADLFLLVVHFQI